ncbi:MAG: MoxR family ATPase [Slackia sp.]|nr:MoxR family ATPase [Slackia sp.]
MNIRQAKEEVARAVEVYLAKDENGSYLIPIERQRPLFLIGAPGVGKTAIMEQVAREMGIGLVSYSMTHHTRQSALGLPYIAERSFDGETFSVSEYTMSEIIASVYESMAETGRREGILFLDEINCVSETLTPAILQFLQYKVFGRHQVPQGWVVVTAGNPSEYNRSTHDFDVATWDRLKRIDVEPDYEAWKAYALATRVHPAIIAYLDAETSDFYHIEATLDGKAFVTARGWDDLSRVMRVYEARGIPVTERLIAQYVQDARTAKRFAVYYDLFNKYRSDYQIDAILEGGVEGHVVERAKAAPFDERVALVGLLSSSLAGRLHAVMLQDAATEFAFAAVKSVAEDCKNNRADAADVRAACSSAAMEYDARAKEGRESRLMSTDEGSSLMTAARFLRAIADETASVDLAQAKGRFGQCAQRLDDAVADAQGALDSAYAFLDAAFGTGKEALLFTTDISADASVVSFIGRYGSESYRTHSRDLMLEERASALQERAMKAVEAH